MLLLHPTLLWYTNDSCITASKVFARMVGTMAIAQMPDESQVVDQTTLQETERLIPGSQQKHHWWYYLLVVLLWVSLIAGGVWLSIGSYNWYTNWYNTALSRSYTTGHTVGLADGAQQGRDMQKAQDVQYFAKLLATYKAQTAKDVQKAKFTSYQAGQNDATKANRVWFENNCAFDSMIHKYICNSSP
jgi:hypothetical protein